MTHNQGSDNISPFIISPAPMDIKLVLAVLTGLFVVATLFFGTKNGFYDSDDYHGNGSAH